MSFSINTNITSLQAQNNLQQSSNFQAKTIGEVTSGLRIVNSGDDAAGLAIANGFRSDEAVLTQGIQNANNGLTTLQTIDGGMNNISTLLDRARTLATQSASGTFTGDRSTLNSEFQSVISEVTRQATSIGMNQGGNFAQALSVFIGGGKGATSAAASVNGSVSLDLSKASVDAQSLGLKGVQAVGAAGTDIGTGSASTKVSDILANAANSASQGTAGYTAFSFSGPGFSDGSKVSVSVNLGGVTDTTTLASALNAAIQTAGNGTTQAATAFKNAGISASVVIDSTGKQQLAFSSSTSAFQVQAGDKTANALLGNFAQNASVQGTDTSAAVAAGGAISTLNIDGNAVSLSGATTTALAAGGSKASIVNALNSDANFKNAATASLNGNQVVIQSNKNDATSSVQIAGSLATSLGISTTTATAASASSGASLNATVTGASATSNNSMIAGAVLGSTTIAATGSATNAVLTSANPATDANIAALNSNAGVGTVGSKSTILGSAVAVDNGSGLAGDTLKLVVNGLAKTVNLTAGDTNLANIVSTINGTAGIGVVASILTPGVGTQKLVFTSSTTGAANTIAVDNTSTAAALTAIGYSGAESSVAGTNTVNDTLVLNVDGVNKNVTINAGDRDLASVMADINNTTLNPALGVTASATGSGAAQKLVLTSTGTAGASDNVTVVTAGTTAELLGGTLGFAGGETASGSAAGSANTDLNVTVGSNSAVNVSLAVGTYTASQMVDQLNSKFTAGSVAATASLDTAGHVVLSANQPGQSLTLNSITSSAYSALGLATGTSSTSLFTSSDNIQVRISGAGMSSPVTLSLNPTVAGSTKVSDVLTDLTSKVTNNSALAAAGISVTTSTDGNNLVFTNNKGEHFDVAATGDTNNALGFGSFSADSTGKFDYSTITGASAFATAPVKNTASTGSLSISLNGGATQSSIGVTLKSTLGNVTGAATADLAVASAALNTKTLKLLVDGTAATVTFTTAETTLSAVAAKINTAAVGVTADIVGTGTNQSLRLTATSGSGSSVAVDGSSTGLAGTGLTAGQTGQGLASAAAVQADAANQINSAIAANSTLSGAGIQATIASNKLVLTSSNNSDFRVSGGGASDLGFGISGGSYAGTTNSAAPVAGRVDSSGAYTSTSMAFKALANGGDSQTISVTANDATGGAHSQAITIQNNASSNTGATIDNTIHAINTSLQQSNDSTLKSIYAVKENNSDGTESIKFQSTTENFKVAVSSVGDGSGVTAPTGGVSTAAQNGSGSNVSIDSIPGAEAAVNALASAVQSLGAAQAVVGKGENNLNYAISLAQSQVTNEAASESQLRDANLAQQAANLTKAQILVQAGTAALSQANSAPQQLISLLQGH